MELKSGLAMGSIALSLVFSPVSADAGGFKTKGEEAMYKLGQCVASAEEANKKPAAVCKRQAAAVCRILPKESFNNPHSWSKHKRLWEKSSPAQRKGWLGNTKRAVNKKIMPRGLKC